MRRIALVGLLVLTLSGCFDAQVQKPPSTKQSFDDYVAIGDTFTAAPYTSKTRKLRGCRRAADNYPTRLARALGIAHVHDVSCVDATTDSVTKPQQIGKHVKIPPQIEAVSRATDLVTIGLGINNDNLYATISAACAPHGRGCTIAAAERYVAVMVADLRQALDSVVRRVQQRADPDAVIVLVGYPRHVSVQRTCKAAPHTTKADRKAWRRIDSSIDLAMSRVARDTGIGYADVYPASDGHDFCSHRPWVRGRKTDKRHGLQLGPTAAEQAAVVPLVRAAIAAEGSD